MTMKLEEMHDWVLKSIDVNWVDGTIKIGLIDSGSHGREIVLIDFYEISIPRFNEWGPSVNIYKIVQESQQGSGGVKLQIQMQSGDVIRLASRQCDFILS